MQAVVYTKGTCAEAQQFDKFCRAQTPPVPLVYAKTVGVFGQVFCDFGPEFVITDTDGASSCLFYNLKDRIRRATLNICNRLLFALHCDPSSHAWHLSTYWSTY